MRRCVRPDVLGPAMPGAAPGGVPESIGDLRRYLQAALELEHLMIPPYLTALYTLRPGHNRAVADAIRGVVLERMLHLALVANVLNAVGGEPTIAHPLFVRRYPARLPYSGQSPAVELRHFSSEALDTFLAIEDPHPPDAPPNDDGWRSIPQFHQAIRDGLRELVGREGHDAVFRGDPGRQVGPVHTYNTGGAVVEVTDLGSALAALDVVVGRGRPATATPYFRFHEIRTGQRYDRYDTVHSGPTGPSLEVSWDEVHPIDPRATVDEYRFGSAVRAHVEEFNLRYASLLIRLESALTGRPDSLEQVVPDMLALRYAAEALVANPSPDRPGLHAGPTFEVPAEVFAEASARLHSIIA